MVYQFDDCILDPQQHRLQRGGQPVRLRAKAFQVLCYLLEHRDRTVLKQELYAQVWPQAFISEATLESTVRAVRQAIGDSGRAQQLIQTVYGYGYRFIGAVEVCADGPAGTAGEGLRSLPSSASAPPPDDDLHATAVAPTLGPAAGGNGHSAAAMGDEREPASQKVAAELASEHQAAPSAVWEQKPVAVLAVECTFPTATEGEAAAYEPWVAASRWEQAFVATVQGFGGVVAQRSPSLLLVVFGVPQTLEQLAQRAVQAALAVRQLVVEGADRKPCPALRLAVHWGALLVDVQASDPTAQLHALGDTLAWPVRLLGQAAPGEILLSPEVGLLAEGWCEVQAREVSLQGGQPGRIQVYTVVRNRPQYARLGLQGRRPLSRFVGRDQELAMLRARLRQVEGGRGQVVGVIGEPGVGKSRLCYEFIRAALTSPWAALETQGTAYGKAIPYLPIIDLLKGYFRLDDFDAPPTVRDKVIATLRGLDDTLTPTTTPAILTLLEVAVEDPDWWALEASQRRQRTLEAIKRLLVWESQKQPLLLVVENLHWIDTERQAVLDALIDSLPAVHLFLLTTYRPEYQHGWGNKTSYTQLRLDPLPHESARDLINSFLGDNAALAPLKQRLIERTQGNPFFLEESIRTLVETQVLVGGRGAYRLAKALPSVQMPSTVQAVLASRIDRLAPEDKRLLQTAAVIGTEVPFPLLQAVAERPEEGLRTGLAHLQGAEFLYETRLFPELVYTFKHALTQEVAYGSLLPDRRRTLHARIWHAIETLNPDRLAEQVERLAHHALRGWVWEKAVAYCRQAGAKAAIRSSYREAVAFYEQALEALQHLPKTRDMLEQAVDLRFDLRASLVPLGEFGRMLDYLREAKTLAEALDDRGRQGWISAYLMNYFVVMGDHVRAIAFAQHALALATDLGNVALQVHAHQRLGRVYLNLGDYCQAVDVLKRNVASLQGKLLWEHFGEVNPPSVQSRGWLVRCLAELGEFAEGIAYAEEAVRLAEEIDRPFGLIQICEGVGSLYLRKGDLHEAIPVLERGLALWKAADVQILLPTSASALAYAYALAGRIAEAVPLLERAVKLATSMRQVPQLALILTRLSESYLLAGGNEIANDFAWQALTLSRDRRERGNEGWALRILGEIASSHGPPELDQAENYYQQALHSGQGASHAPAAGPLLSRPWHPLWQNRPAGASLRRTVRRYRTLSHHGHDLLAAPDRGGSGSHRRMITPRKSGQ